MMVGSHIKNRPKVLFLCTGNSARSQLAEAIVNSRLGERWQAFSAGTHPTGSVHPAAIQALAEIGIQHQGRSKLVDELRHTSFDLIVTVCDSAAQECPLWLGPGQRIHFSFPDPAKVEGDPHTILEAFRQVRQAIAAEIPALLEKIEKNG